MIEICLQGQVGKTELLAALAQALDFPDWFGHNWDALAESLDEYLAQRDDAGQALELVFDLSQVTALDEADWAVLLEILEEARESWPGFVYQVVALAADSSLESFQ